MKYPFWFCIKHKNHCKDQGLNQAASNKQLHAMTRALVPLHAAPPDLLNMQVISHNAGLPAVQSTKQKMSSNLQQPQLRLRNCDD